MLSFNIGEHNVVEEAIPLVEFPVSIRLDKPPVSVRLELHGKKLPVSYDDGHGMLVFSILHPTRLLLEHVLPAKLGFNT